jgi:hypothetical protein
MSSPLVAELLLRTLKHGTETEIHSWECIFFRNIYNCHSVSMKKWFMKQYRYICTSYVVSCSARGEVSDCNVMSLIGCWSDTLGAAWLTESIGPAARLVAYVTKSCCYIPADQGLPISSEGAGEFPHRARALEGSREGKGEAAFTVHLSLDLRIFATRNLVKLYLFFDLRTLLSLQQEPTSDRVPSVLVKKVCSLFAQVLMLILWLQ